MQFESRNVGRSHTLGANVNSQAVTMSAGTQTMSSVPKQCRSEIGAGCDQDNGMRAQQKVQTWDRVAGCSLCSLGARWPAQKFESWLVLCFLVSWMIKMDFCIKRFPRTRKLGTTRLYLFDVYDPDLCLTVYIESVCKCCGAFVQWWQTKIGE